ncbi:hypothetical protein JCM15519_07980 [Fundidesulfovibrio butyratiphilus]
MMRFRRSCLYTGLLALFLLAAQAPLSAEPLPDMVLIEENATITATVGEEDGEGLWVVTNDGANYSVWTPEDVTLDDISAFQQHYKNKEVTLHGAVYKDKFNNLNLFVKSLPK